LIPAIGKPNKSRLEGTFASSRLILSYPTIRKHAQTLYVGGIYERTTGPTADFHLK
jgi:hypothetical protein